jgi:hypothetical protein
MAATKNGHTGIPSPDGFVADADGPGVPVLATVSRNAQDLTPDPSADVTR